MLKITSVTAIGHAEDQNPRWRKSMEDATTMVDRFGNCPTTGFFAVYDGHGGVEAAKTASETLHKLIAEEAAKVQPQEILNFDDLDYQKVFVSAVQREDQLQKQQQHVYVGCTACCLLLTQKHFLLLNIGDSRAVLYTGKAAKRLTKDHKATDQQENQRIKEAGGAVVNGRVNGFISVSRALGDWCIKQLVISEPDCFSYDRQKEDCFVIIGCDGLFDVVSDEEACEIVKKTLQLTQSPQRAAAELKNHALKANTQDNVSVLVLILKDLQAMVE